MGGLTRWTAVFGPGIDQILWWSDGDSNRSYVPLVDHRNAAVAMWDVNDGKMSELAGYDAYGRTTIYDAFEDVMMRTLMGMR